MPAAAGDASPGLEVPMTVQLTPRSASAAAVASPIRPAPTTMTSSFSAPPRLFSSRETGGKGIS